MGGVDELIRTPFCVLDTPPPAVDPAPRTQRYADKAALRARLLHAIANRDEFYEGAVAY